MNKLRFLPSILAISILLMAYSAGPPDGYTGAPSEQTCGISSCHGNLNSGAGVVSLTGPRAFLPGDTLRFRVNVQQQGQRRWGFELTALDASNRPAGNIIVTDNVHTQKTIAVFTRRQYLKHTETGTYLNTVDSSPGWEFAWVAPDSTIAQVTFYVAGNAANGNFDSSGDFIYTTRANLDRLIIDREKALSFFPVHSGNEWQYQITTAVAGGEIDTTYETIIAGSDTTLPNGKTYRLRDALGQFLRVDSTNLKVYRYDPSSLEPACGDSEVLQFELFPPTDGSFTNCKMQEVLVDTGFGPLGLLADSVGYLKFDWSDSVDNTFFLAQRVGITEWSMVGTTAVKGKLVYALIDGERYGEPVISGVKDRVIFPAQFQLLQNYPNPFNPSTTIAFNLSHASEVSLIIYDVAGRKIADLVNGRQEAGIHKLVWHSKGLSAGVYIVQLGSDGLQVMRRMILLK